MVNPSLFLIAQLKLKNMKKKVGELFTKLGPYFADHGNRLSVCLCLVFSLLGISGLVCGLIHIRPGNTLLMALGFVLAFLSFAMIAIILIFRKKLLKKGLDIIGWLVPVYGLASGALYIASVSYNVAFMFWFPLAIIVPLIFLDLKQAMVGGILVTLEASIYILVPEFIKDIPTITAGFKAIFLVILFSSFILGTISGLASAHINAAELDIADGYRNLAFMDALTGLNNHAYYDYYVKTTEDGALLPLKMGVLFIDVDNLKHINDTYGHAAGNEALIAVAKALREANTQEAIRYAGDEFLVIEPGLEEDALGYVASRIQEAVAKQKLDLCPGWTLTVSIGGSTGEIKGVGDIKYLVKKADAELYNSKRGGRNRTTIGK